MHRNDTGFLVRPLEPLYFGKPQSFSAGESHHGRSELPPSPQTFQGLVRSHLLRMVDPPLDLDDWSKAAKAEREILVGGPERLPRGWQLDGPLLVEARTGIAPDAPQRHYACPWLPVPRFLLHAEGRPAPVHARPVESAHPGSNDLGDDKWLVGRPDLDAVWPLTGWIGPENLRYALATAGQDGGATWHPGKEHYGTKLPPFVRWESHPGVAIDHTTGSVQEGMLYLIETIRFGPGGGLAGWLSGKLDDRIPANALERGAAATGRKARPVAMEPLPALHPDWQYVHQGEHLPDEVSDEDCFWLVLLTPARIADTLSPDLSIRLPSDVRIRFRATLTGASLTLGGHRMVSSQSLSNRCYLAAGSAWLFQLVGGTAIQRGQALRLLHDAHPLGPPEQAPFGFGHTFVGLGPMRNRREP